MDYKTSKRKCHLTGAKSSKPKGPLCEVQLETLKKAYQEGFEEDPDRICVYCLRNVDPLSEGYEGGCGSSVHMWCIDYCGGVAGDMWKSVCQALQDNNIPLPDPCHPDFEFKFTLPSLIQ
jgi:hypothetical protein